jgi:hypothetical protein
LFCEVFRGAADEKYGGRLPLRDLVEDSF